MPLPFVTEDGKDFYVTGTGGLQRFYVQGDSDEFTINLYKNSAESNRVDKTAFLENVGSLSGTLRESTDLLNPAITIEYSSVPTFNYVHIPKFNRYYFVRNIISVYKNLWVIELDVDVLMSYKTDILNLNAYVARQENWQNCQLALSTRDPLLPVANTASFSKEDFPYMPFTTSNVVGNFKNVAITVVGRNAVASAITDPVPRCITNPSSKFPRASLLNTVYITDVDGLKAFFDALWSGSFLENLKNIFNDPLESVISVRAYPFDLSQRSSYITNLTASDKIYVGKAELPVSSTDITKFAIMKSNYYNIYDFGELLYEPITDAKDKYKLYSPYSEVYIYIPYVGIIKLNNEDVVNKYLSLECAVDFSTGDATMFLYSSPKLSGSNRQWTLINSYGCSIGQDLPYSAVSSVARTRTIIRSITDAVGSATNIVTGVAKMF